MLVLRLQRAGRKNLPTYRIVVSEKSKHASKGAHEILGFYLPKGEKPSFECDQARVSHWIKQGAVPSNTLARLLKKAGMNGMEPFMEKYTKKRPKGEEPAAPAAPAAAPAEAAPAA